MGIRVPLGINDFVTFDLNPSGIYYTNRKLEFRLTLTWENECHEYSISRGNYPTFQLEYLILRKSMYVCTSEKKCLSTYVEANQHQRAYTQGK